MAEKRKILIVDDEVEQCDCLNELLTGRDYDVTIATAGKKALELIKDNFYPVILLDIRMPDIDGETVLKETLKLRPSSKVVMVTGQDDEERKAKCLALGAREYITKPVEFIKLFDMLNMLYKETNG